jgi:SAM-dependent methyltransferase
MPASDPSVPIPHTPDEPLARLARFAFDWAPALCCPAHGCTTYHRVWSALRLVESGGALPAGRAFFHAKLRSLASDARVLISGGADTGLLALAASAFHGRTDPPTFVFSDRCETTVMQNRLLAGSLGLRVELKLADIRELDCEPVDAVLAHSFLIYFDADGQDAVARNWSRLLKPGGRLLMSNRLVANQAEHPRERDPADIESKLQALDKRLSILDWPTDDRATLKSLAGQLWSVPKRGPLSERRLRDCLARAGLLIESLAATEADAQGPVGYFSRNLSRWQIVARKPPVD